MPARGKRGFSLFSCYSRVLGLIALSVLAQGAWAANCDSQSAGTWNSVGRWSCGHIPVAADTVVIKHNITLDANRTVAGLTVNVGVTFDGNGNNLRVRGPVVVNGTYDTGGGDLTTTSGGSLTVNTGGTFNFNNGNAVINGNVAIDGTLTSGGDNLQMTGASTTLSGVGNIVDTTIEIDAAGVSVPFGANLLFDANSEIDVGANNPGSLTVNGKLDGTAQGTGDRIIRVSTDGTLTVGSSGIVNAPSSRLEVRDGASATNNGVISIGELRGRTGAPTPVFTQGANSTLNVSVEVCIATRPCTFNASAAGNTVNYNGAAQTVYLPSGSTYSNLTLSGNGAKTLPTGMTVTGNFTMTDTATTTAPAALAVGGNFSIGAGNTFTPGTGTVVLNGTLAQTIGGGAANLSLFNLTVSNTAGITLARNVVVTGTLSGTVTLTSTCPTDYTLTSNGGATIQHSCNTMMDHVAINAPATAMTFSTSPVVINPHTSAHAAMPGAVINLSTSTGRGDWTIGSGVGTLTPGAADSGQATYTFGMAESSVILDFTHSAAGTVTINVTDAWAGNMLLNTPTGEKANTIAYTMPDYVFTNSTCIHNIAFGAGGQTCTVLSWSPRVAGVDFTNVYITALNNSGIPTRFHPTSPRTRNMQFALSCHNPVANAGLQATFSGVTLPLCQANGATPVTWSGSTLAALFPAGIPSAGPYVFNYPDVGKVELWMRDSAATANVGASGIFVVAPHHFDLSGILQTAAPNLANPAAADAAGNKFVKAGEPFSVTVTARNFLNAATPNFGRETSAESVKLTSTLVAPASGNNPALGGTFGAFTGGIATGTNFTWNEVGIITLTPSVGDADYLGAGDRAGTTSGNVGRFYPDHFALTPGTVTPGCGVSFTYFGQDGVTTAFTLTAQNATNGTTQNYTGSFSKLGLTSWSNFGFTSDAPSGSTLSASVATAPSGTWGAGITSSLQATHLIGRPTVLPSAPGTSSVTISAVPVDTDGVTMTAVAVAPATPLYFGRLWLGNAYGSDKLNLLIPFETQYWNGSVFVKNTSDNCTAIADANVAFGNQQGGLKPPVLASAYAGPVTGSTASSGAGSLTLTKPSSAATGSVDLVVNLGSSGSPSNCVGLTGGTSAALSYLSGKWCGSNYDRNPVARATFGIYGGKRGPIYIRESY